MERPNRIRHFTLLLPSLLLLTSCNNNGRGESLAENPIDFDTIRIAARHHLEDDTTKPYCDIGVEFIYPVNSEKISLDTLQKFFVTSMFGPSFGALLPSQAMDAYVKSYVENYIHDANTYGETLTDMNALNALIPETQVPVREHDADNIFYSYYENLSDSIVYNQHGILSFQVKQSNNKRGSSSDYVSYTNFVINLQTGNQITESEIFRAGYDASLQDLIVTLLLDQNQAKSIEELEDLGFFGIREIAPNGNFLVNDKGIIYTYNKGEYSAYQLSAPEVFIPYRAIGSLLRDNTLVSKLADLQ